MSDARDQRVEAVEEALNAYLDEVGLDQLDTEDLAVVVVSHLERGGVPPVPDAPTVEALAAAVSAAAARLALRTDVAEAGAPHEVLYALATAVAALEAPVRALAPRAEREAAERYAAAELNEALAGLRQVERALQRARGEWQ